AEQEIDGWRIGEPFALAPRMQAVTLAVIMGGIFGIEGAPAPGTVEHRFYRTIRRLTALSTHPLWHLVEWRNLGRLEARGGLRRLLDLGDREIYSLIGARRGRGESAGSTDGLSLLLATRDEDGQALGVEGSRGGLLALAL